MDRDLLASRASGGSSGLKAFLAATAIPTRCSTPLSDADGRAVVERFGVLPDELLRMVCPDGTVLKRPTDAEAGVILSTELERLVEGAAGKCHARDAGRKA